MPVRLLALALLVAAGTGACPGLPAQAASTPSAAPQETGAPPDAAANLVSGAAIVQTALRYLGYPYTTVGNSPQTGFSCIGFVSYIYRSNGIPLPDDLWQARAYAPAVPFSSLLPGDILFFGNTVWAGLSHTAIYLGGGRFIHAEWYNRGVVISSFNNDPVDGNYWIGKYLGANRPWGGSPGAAIVPLRSITTASTDAGPVALTVSPKAVLVSVPALNLRSSPSTASSLLEVLIQGTPVVVLLHRGGWYRIRLADGTVGWVVAAGLNVPAGSSGGAAQAKASASIAPSPITATVTASTLRVHSGPGLTAPVIGATRRGDRVQILTEAGGWARVRLLGGLVGWVSAAFLGPHRKPAPPVRPATLTATVRVHSAPALTAPVVQVAAAGTHVQVVSSRGSWRLVRLPRGTTGYVFATYVK